MHSLFLTIYYRPGTNIIVLFLFGYTNIQYAVIENNKEISLSNLDKLQVDSIIEYSNGFHGDNIIGSGQCRFENNNPNYSYKVYLINSNLTENQAKYKLDKIRNQYSHLAEYIS